MIKKSAIFPNALCLWIPKDLLKRYYGSSKQVVSLRSEHSIHGGHSINREGWQSYLLSNLYVQIFSN